MKNRSLMQAALKCTWRFVVAEKGVNFRDQALLQETEGIRTGPVTGPRPQPLLPDHTPCCRRSLYLVVATFVLLVTFFHLPQLW